MEVRDQLDWIVTRSYCSAAADAVTIIAFAFAKCSCEGWKVQVKVTGEFPFQRF